MVVYLAPSLPVPQDYRLAMVEYVRNGGKILVVDSAENSKSTANTLLRPFEMSVKHDTNFTGDLTAPGYPTVGAAGVCEVSGGKPFAFVNSKPVGATMKFGKGSVTTIGYGVRFNDLNMGVTGDVVPDKSLREVYEVEYRLLRSLIEGPAATQPATTQPMKIEPIMTGNGHVGDSHRRQFCSIYNRLEQIADFVTRPVTSGLQKFQAIRILLSRCRQFIPLHRHVEPWARLRLFANKPPPSSCARRSGGLSMKILPLRSPSSCSTT
jgi:hypothetical protein